MKVFKKFSVFLLSFAMVLSLLSGFVFADEEAPATGEVSFSFQSERAFSAAAAGENELQTLQEDASEEDEYHIWFDTGGNNRIFNDQTREVVLNLKDIIDSGIPYEIGVLGIGYFQDEEFVPFTEGVEYQIEDIDIGKRIFFNGEKIYETMAGTGENRIFLHTDVGTIPDDPDDPEARGTWLAAADTQLELREVKEEYEKINDQEVLPGTAGTFGNEYWVYVENGEYPFGQYFSYKVLNLEILPGSDDIFSEFRKEYEDEDETSEHYWWFVKIAEKTLGTAELKVTYEDLSGAEQSYTFKVISKTDLYEIEIDAGGRYAGLPGETLEVSAFAWHHQYDMETGERSDTEITKDAEFEWTLDEIGLEVAELTPNQEKASVYLLEREGEENFWNEFSVFAAVTYNGEEIGSAENILCVSDGFINLVPEKIDQLKIGESIVVTTEVRDFNVQYEDPGYVLIPDTHFVWEYDPNAICVTDADGVVVGNYNEEGEYNDSEASTGTSCSFTITRLSGYDTEFSLKGEKQEEFALYQDYGFERQNTEIWFEEPETDRVFTDGSLELEVNTENLEGSGAGLKFRFLKDDEGEPEDLELTEGVDYELTAENRIVLNGKAICEKLGQPQWIRVCAEAVLGEYASEEAEIWIEVRDTKLDYAEYEPDGEYHSEDLMGTFGYITKEHLAYVENTEYPNGEQIPYYVLDAKLVSDPDGIITSFEELEGAFQYELSGETEGDADFLLTLQDIDGTEKTCHHLVHSKQDVYWVNLESANRINSGFPDDVIPLVATGAHFRYQDGEIIEVPLEDERFVWEDLDGNPYGTLVADPDDPSSAELTLSVPEEEKQDPYFAGGIDVGVLLIAEEDGEWVEKSFARHGFLVANHYGMIWPAMFFGPDDEIPAGTVGTLNAEFREYNAFYEGEKYRTKDDVTFFVRYDDEALEIMDEEGNLIPASGGELGTGGQLTFKIKPLLENNVAYFELTATYKEDDHFFEERQNYEVYSSEKHEHELVKVEAKAPACETEGNIEHWRCTGCGRLFAEEAGTIELTPEEVLIPATGHTPGEPVIENRVWPTFDKEGSWDEVVYCTVCGKELSRITTTVPKLIPKPGWNQAYGQWYYFNNDLVMQKGWLAYGRYWYYLDPQTGVMQTGWQKIGGVWYFLYNSGAMATGWVNDNGVWYYMNQSGAMLAKQWLKYKDTWYFLKGNGAMANNEWLAGYWFSANGGWYYKAIGSWKKNNTGWWFGDTYGWYAKNETVMINGTAQHFDASGYWIDPAN